MSFAMTFGREINCELFLLFLYLYPDLDFVFYYLMRRGEIGTPQSKQLAILDRKGFPTYLVLSHVQIINLFIINSRRH